MGSQSGPVVMPKRMNQAGINALFTANQLKGDLEQCLQLLREISPASLPYDVCSVLSSVEDRLLANKTHAQQIKRSEASEVMEEVWGLIKKVEHSLANWRSQYPDTSPIKVNNGMPLDIFLAGLIYSPNVSAIAFLNPNRGHLAPTLIAYSLALSQRVFAGASELSANIILQFMHSYGAAIAALGSNPPTVLQTRALDATAVDIRTVENQFNLGIETVIHAICPCCNYLYEPQHSPTSPKPTYPAVCTNRSPHSSPPCNEPLVDDQGRPFKIFEYYPFFDWFARFIAQPKIQQYARAFCDHVRNNPVAPPDKTHTADGEIYRVLLGPDGKLFVDGGEECRFFFLFYADSFNTEGTTGRRKSRSTGVVSLKCLNLPYDIREDDVNVYIPGFWRGPREPNAIDAQHAHLLKPVFSDLEKAYTRGMKCAGSPDEANASVPGEECISRAMVAGACLDLKAARPVAGVLDATSHYLCTCCSNFHQESILRTDHANWARADDEIYREGMEKWREAQTISEREAIEHYYGTRYSPMMLLKYFKLSTQLIPDPMHAFYHRILQLYFRNALGLTTLSSKVPSPYESDIAFYHEFAHPPRPRPRDPQVDNTDSEEFLAYLEWEDLTEEQGRVRLSRIKNWLTPAMKHDIRALSEVVKGHQLLSQKRPKSDTPGGIKLRKRLLKRLTDLRWISLVYICNDLWILPFNNCDDEHGIPQKSLRKSLMAESLVEWVSQEHYFNGFNLKVV